LGSFRHAAARLDPAPGLPRAPGAGASNGRAVSTKTKERTVGTKNVAVAGGLGLSVSLGVAVLAVLSMGQVAPPGLGDPLPGVTPAEHARFLAGKAAFQEVEDVAGGLGPVFNENACAVCHKVGAVGGGGTRLETRFGRLVAGQFDPMTYAGGSLIQDQGIGLFNGVNFQGEVVPAAATIVAQRRTTPLFGLGLVDSVPDAVFHQLALLQQVCSPATAGRVNPVTNVATGQVGVGKFGWKCQHPALLPFAGDAYLNEMGVTTPMFPLENCPQGQCNLLLTPGLPAVPNDADNSTVVAFADFMTFLGPPPRGPVSDQARQGAGLFSRVGCADCHVPSLQTGPNASAALSHVMFFPYSDFLLHDMGSLGDGTTQSGAGPHEMRTAPLWGVRLATTLLHDGRATSLTAAILAHDGQARPARNKFSALSKTQQAQLLAFLNTL
jgi:CxxC motif-containing protein (DUF1111 family)